MKKKKLIIGAGVAAIVVAGGIAAFGKPGKEVKTVPQVEVVCAETGDVQQTVEASGTVVSEEEKTYFSPANAKVEEVAFKEGETVKAGTRLVEFNMKDLEREQKKAELSVQSGKLDMENTLNKSNKAVQKQKKCKEQRRFSGAAGKRSAELCGCPETAAVPGYGRRAGPGGSRDSEKGGSSQKSSGRAAGGDPKTV